MATLAKDSITLMPVNDAYSVSLSPSSIVVRADADGNFQTREDFSALYFYTINVTCGAKQIAFSLSKSSDSGNCQYECKNLDDKTWMVRLTSVTNGTHDGFIKVSVSVGKLFKTEATMSFSVVRESSLLDWIKDWNSNKTKIGGEYVITPKIFVGKREKGDNGLSTLSGVYIGQDNGELKTSSPGIYGFKNSAEIFHINSLGALIGGWSIEQGGIQTSDGLMKIMSQGSIISLNNDGNTLWGIYKDGSASFANGNVQFFSDGSASYKGEITALTGKIGGWSISPSGIYNEHLSIDSVNNYIGISRIPSLYPPGTINVHQLNVKQGGGIYMHYTNVSEYGIACYLPKASDYRLIFSLGNVNKIANWSFEEDALYIGTKNNQLGEFTTESGSVTIGSNGLRGYSWCIDKDGEAKFANGRVVLGHDNATIAGWNIYQNAFGTGKIALVSTDSPGLYITSSGDFSSADVGRFSNIIEINGGMSLVSNGSEVSLIAVKSDNSVRLVTSSDKIELEAKKNNSTVFLISSSSNNKIGAWYFDNDALYTGNKTTTGYSSDGEITLGKDGLRGSKWRLEKDGSGAFAGGNISWDSDGNMQVSSNFTAGALKTGNGGPHVEISGSEINVFGMTARNIRFGVNSQGLAVLEYYDNDGKLLYNLGPSGYVEIKSKDNSWSLQLLKKINDRSTLKDILSVRTTDCTTYYLFKEGWSMLGDNTLFHVSGKSNPSEYNNCIFSTDELSGAKQTDHPVGVKINGWFVEPSTGLKEDYLVEDPEVSNLYVIWLYHYQNGLLEETVPVLYTDEIVQDYPNSYGCNKSREVLTEGPLWKYGKNIS